MPDQRFNKRVDTLLKVSYREFAGIDDTCSIDFAENLSSTGMFIASYKPMKPGTVLVLEFPHPISKHFFKLKGMVMWSRMNGEPRKGLRKGMGVKFLGLTPEDKEKIQQIVDIYKKANKTSNI